MNKKSPILTAAGLSPNQYSKTRRGGSWPQHHCIPRTGSKGGRGCSDTSVGQLRSGCAYYFGPCARAKLTTSTHGAATEPTCPPSWTSGSTAQKPEKLKSCSKTYAPSTECHLNPCASDSDFSAPALSIMQVFSLLPMVPPTPSTLER